MPSETSSPGRARLALGTVQLGLAYGIANRAGQVTRDEAASILERARAAGVDTLDTAIAYGNSEATLGAIGMGGWRVVTKLPPYSGDDATRWVSDALSGSLTRLRTQSVYGLLLHRSSDLAGSDGQRIYDAMDDARRRGLVHKIGVSIYDPAELAPLMGRFRLDLVQAPFNVIDRRLATSGWLDRLAGAAVEVHARSVFLQGLLLMERSARPRQFARWSPVWDAWDGWLSEANLSPATACLAFVLSHAQVGRAVVGVDSCRQLDELLAAADAAHDDAYEFPAALMSEDSDLVNPSRWTAA